MIIKIKNIIRTMVLNNMIIILQEMVMDINMRILKITMLIYSILTKCQSKNREKKINLMTDIWIRKKKNPQDPTHPHHFQYQSHTRYQTLRTPSSNKP